MRRKRKKRSLKGKYKLKNHEKYIGDKSKIIWRSSWERDFCAWCDRNNNVLKWVIEPFFINYFDKGNNKSRKYYPDFYIEMTKNRKYLIEVKPYKETIPVKRQKVTKKIIIEERTYLTNQSKWEAAKKLSEKRGWKFVVITENELHSMGIRKK